MSAGRQNSCLDDKGSSSKREFHRLTDETPAGLTPVLAGREQALELVLAVLGYDEEQLVAGLDRLLGLGDVDLAVAEDDEFAPLVAAHQHRGGVQRFARMG